MARKTSGRMWQQYQDTVSGLLQWEREETPLHWPNGRRVSEHQAKPAKRCCWSGVPGVFPAIWPCGSQPPTPAEPGQKGSILLHDYLSKERFPGSGERHSWVVEELTLREAERTYDCHFPASVSCYRETGIVSSPA